MSDSARVVRVELGGERWSGWVERTGHFTFHGSVLLEFPSPHPGGPPLWGRADGVVLDVFAPGRTPELPERPFDAFVGLALSPELEVLSVEVGSEAETAGVRVGDRLVELDGVRLGSRADFVPARGTAVSRLVLSRPGETSTVVLFLERSAYQPGATELTIRSLAVLTALLLALLVAARPPGLLTWLSLRLGRRWASVGARAVEASKKRETPSSPAFDGALLCLALLCVASLGFVERLLPLGSDWVSLLGVALGLATIAAFWAGGRRSTKTKESFSFVGGLIGLGATWVGLGPLLLASGVAAFDRGSFQLATDRGGTWGELSVPLFGSPWMLAGGLASVLALVPGIGRRPPRDGAAPLGTFEQSLFRLALALFCVLWVRVFLPTLPLPAALSWVWWGGGSALCFEGILWVRRALGEPRAGEVFRSIALLSWGLSGFAVGSYWLSLVVPNGDPTSILGLVTMVFFIALLGACGVSFSRAWQRTGRLADPWM